MKDYKFKYMSEPMLEEMEGLLKSEHGTTLTLWGAECANAGARGLTKSIGKGILLGVGVGAAVALGEKVVKKIKEKKRAKEVEQYINDNIKD